MMRRPVLSSIVAGTALVLGTLACAGPSNADPAVIETPIDTDLCEGTPIWTGGFTADQPVTGLTTVEGNVTEEFQGTYVDTITDPYGNDIYLFDLSGSRITGGHKGQGPAGIWAGISGSPVYDLDGNLIGSVSYSFTDTAASTLAGVTPAANIITADPTVPTPVTLTRSDRTALARAGVANASSLRTARPIALQRVSAGSPADTANAMTARSRYLARNTSATGSFSSAGLANLNATPITPGSSIGSSYSYGATALASVGTVTAICGENDLYAFGHPVEASGETFDTILKSQVLTIVSNNGQSYPLVNLDTTPVGAMVSDNTNGVHGVLGASHDTARVDTHTTANGATDEKTSIVSTPFAIPAVVGTQVRDATFNAFKKYSSGDATVTLSVDFVRAGSSTSENLSVSFRESHRDFFPDQIGFSTASRVESILSNGFEDVTITEVDVTLNLTPAYRAYRITGAQYRKGSVWKNVPAGGKIPAKMGAKIPVRVKLGPALGSKVAPATVETTWHTAGSIKKQGAFTFYGQSFNYSEEEEYFEEGEDSEDAGSLDDILTAIASQPRADDVLAQYRFRNGNGGYTRFRNLRAPGVVSGTIHLPLKY